jgi:hypothetical protein
MDLPFLSKLGLRSTALLLSAVLVIPMACLIGAHPTSAVFTPAHSGCHQRTDTRPAPPSPDEGNNAPHQKCCRAAQPAEMVAIAGASGSESLNVELCLIAAPVPLTQELAVLPQDAGRSVTPPTIQILRV